MKKTVTILITFVLIFLVRQTARAGERTKPLIIDHTCEKLSEIPMNWIDSVQANQKWHYAHTSHGSQLTTGLQRIEDSNSDYSQARGSSFLPTEAGAFCIFDGQESDTYITPEEYWRSESGMNETRDVLNDNPTITVSQWSWCTQLNSYSEADVVGYLDSISTLEAEFPNVTFVYMTGNAQATGSGGYNRYLRNEQIRQYCRDHNKVLYDFADLDAWWYNSNTGQWEQNTYDYEGHTVPVENEHFNGSESGHTTYESCEQKGRAVWWLMARLSGWEDVTSALSGRSVSPMNFELMQNYPNPFGEGSPGAGNGNGIAGQASTVIRYTLNKNYHVRLTVYNALGQVVQELVNRDQQEGVYTVSFNASHLASGIYIYKLDTGSAGSLIKKMILIR